MKIEDQDLLLKELCGRLPYWVKCIVKSDGYVGVISSIDSLYGIATFDNGRQEEICDIMPYLFPLSNMTEEQKVKYGFCYDLDLANSAKNLKDELDGKDTIDGYPLYNHIDYLNMDHFDYRGLIAKGLAIDVTGLNIYKEETK